ncbi:hypothetical protein H9P43_003571 [Blastocladiella emersonii ATCC 22665]|nr:hypothetical protein H9P43_003571 [Blastocladiella emersonii ATCC 22665]
MKLKRPSNPRHAAHGGQNPLAGLEAPDDLLQAAFEQEAQGDRYAHDPAKSRRHYQHALDAYTAAYARDPDPETLYNAARLHLVLADRTAANDAAKLDLLDRAIAMSQHVLVKTPTSQDALFNLGQAHVWRAQLVAERGGDECVPEVAAGINVALEALAKVTEMQRADLAAGSADVGDASAPAEDDGAMEMSGDVELTEATPVTRESLLETLLLRVECHALAVEVLPPSEVDAHVAAGTQVLAEAQSLVATLPAPAFSAPTNEISTKDPEHPYLEYLLASSAFHRATAERHAAVTGSPSAEAFERALAPLAEVQTLCAPRVHARAHGDAGDVYVSWFESLLPLATTTSGDDSASLAVWQHMASATRSYAAALARDPNNGAVLVHLAENEWNRAAWSARVGQAGRVAATLTRNAAVYADRAWRALRAGPLASERMEERTKAFGILCDALEKLGLAADLAQARAVGP